MKPTPQISSQRSASAPLTDYNYQSTADAKTAARRQIAKLTGFHKLSSDYLGAETSRHDATDFFVFTLMALLCAWPIVAVVFAISRAFNGY